MVQFKKKIEHFAEVEILKSCTVSINNIEFMFQSIFFLTFRIIKFVLWKTIPAKKEKIPKIALSS